MALTFGPIFNMQKDKVREWSISVRMFDANGAEIDIHEPSSISVGSDYYCEYTTLSGYVGMKMTQSKPTVISVGKNIGKKNETSVLEQAIKECKSKYAAKIKTGYTDKQITTETHKVDTSAMPFPMAVKKWAEFGKKLHYPLYIQPKLDGARLLARLEGDQVVLYTRRLVKVVGFERLKNELLSMFNHHPNLKDFIVDGEMYRHGMNLQDISGIFRNVSMSEDLKDQLKYHVFDMFSTDKKNSKMVFPQRHELLMKFINVSNINMVIANPTNLVDSELAAEDMYNDYVRNGYEGIIYKSADKPYEFDFNKEKRSSWYLKRKKQEDAEFEIVGFTHGNGKNADCIVFELKTANGKVFNCVPNGTYEYLKQLYKLAVKEFDAKLKGRLAKVLYDDLSKDGVPLRGRIVQLDRDLSFD